MSRLQFFKCVKCGEEFEPEIDGRYTDYREEFKNGRVFCPKCKSDEVSFHIACHRTVKPPKQSFLKRLLGR
jgi:DNA-directed RNA polymerase subunit RPC12/RpoP